MPACLPACTACLPACLRIRSWKFTADLVGCLPLDWLILDAVAASTGAGQQALAWLSLAKLTKLLRLYRVFDFFTHIDYEMIIGQGLLLFLRTNTVGKGGKGRGVWTRSLAALGTSVLITVAPCQLWHVRTAAPMRPRTPACRAATPTPTRTLTLPPCTPSDTCARTVHVHHDPLGALNPKTLNPHPHCTRAQYTFFTTHWAACIFYLIAMLERWSPQSWVGRNAVRFIGQPAWKRYILSLYFSVSSFTGLGDNSLYASTVPEAAFMILYLFFNLFLGAYIFGERRGTYLPVAALSGCPSPPPRSLHAPRRRSTRSIHAGLMRICCRRGTETIPSVRVAVVDD